MAGRRAFPPFTGRVLTPLTGVVHRSLMGVVGGVTSLSSARSAESSQIGKPFHERSSSLCTDVASNFGTSGSLTVPTSAATLSFRRGAVLGGVGVEGCLEVSWRRRASLPDGCVNWGGKRNAGPLEPAFAGSEGGASRVLGLITAKGSVGSTAATAGRESFGERLEETSACEGILVLGGGDGWWEGRRAGTREEEDALLWRYVRYVCVFRARDTKLNYTNLRALAALDACRPLRGLSASTPLECSPAFSRALSDVAESTLGTRPAGFLASSEDCASACVG